MEEWTVNANEAVSISLGDVTEPPTNSFHPTFTYPIFGDQELIYGYKGLTLDLVFDQYDLLSVLRVNYTSKLHDNDDDEKENHKGDGNIQDDEALKRLYQVLSDDAIVIDCHGKREAEIKREIRDKVSRHRSRVGELTIDTIEDKKHVGKFKGKTSDEEYEVFGMKMVDNALKLHRRLRIFVLFFIEAGSYIDDSDDRWELYLIYKKAKSNNNNNDKFEFAGFSTVYTYFWYRDSATHCQSNPLKEFNQRKRISQFVIIPPFQHLGIGGQFYSTMFDHFMTIDSVKEIAVEDPSEQFDDLRDRCDLKRLCPILFKDDTFVKGFPLTDDWLLQTRLSNKMATRQFDRCLEMAMLQLTTLSQDRKLPPKSYRLQVKRRLYVRNKDVLDEIEDESQKKHKLQETFERLIEDYIRIVDKVDFSVDGKGKKRPISQVQ